MTFLYPLVFLLYPFLIYCFFFWKKRSSLTIGIPYLAKNQIYVRDWSNIFRFFCLSFLILALARPQTHLSSNKKQTEGIDLVLVIDTSTSMKALDFQENGKRKDRLTIVKSVLKDFIAKRQDDRIGLVVFGSQAYPQAPLTMDHDVILSYIDSAQIGMAGESTAIGDGLGVGIARLKDVSSPSKILILLTDGSNNAGKIDPMQAALMAKELKIKIYTIGIGSSEPVPIETPFGLQRAVFELDEKLLLSLAQKTGGLYFKASDTEKLKEIYEKIDELEKTKTEQTVYFEAQEEYRWFLYLSLIGFFLELLWFVLGLRPLPL